jgi:uroporphyrinogen decarboxylase
MAISSRHGQANSGQMTHRERVRAVLQGEAIDRPAISLWHHFPGQDDTPEKLTASTIAFQQEYDVDLIKLMPTGMYSVLDYGVEVYLSGDTIGTTRFAAGPIKAPSDWAGLPVVSPERGALGDQVEVVRRVRAALGPDVPIIQTIFSPLTMATKVAGTNEAVLAAIERDEAALEEGLARMASDVVAFGRACLEAGADGFFFATQLASRATFPEAVYRRFGVPYDLQVLRALRSGAWCTILHLHGLEPLFGLAQEYPVDAVNWHDRETEPGLSAALGQTVRSLVAGIARMGAVVSGTTEEAAAQVRDAVAQTGGHRLIVAPGCVIPTNAPAANLHALRQAIEDCPVAARPSRPTARGHISGIFITPTAGRPLEPVPAVTVRAGYGIVGDRYEAGEGTWSQRPGGGRELTLIAQEDLEAMARESGIRLAPVDSRRNLLTTGVDLRSLVGRRFRIGTVTLQGIRLCQPCSYLEEKTTPGVLKALVDRGGLRVDVLTDGQIAVGDQIEG